MRGGVELTTPPKSTKSVGAYFYEIMDNICKRFVGLSPFEVLKMDLQDVMDLYVDMIVYESKQTKPSDGVLVTSKTATWY